MFEGQIGFGPSLESNILLRCFYGKFKCVMMIMVGGRHQLCFILTGEGVVQSGEEIPICFALSFS